MLRVAASAHSRTEVGVRPVPASPLLLRCLTRVLTARRARRNLLILMFHRVLPSPDVLRPQDIAAETFAWQLRVLAAQFDILPLPAALAALDSGTLKRPSLSITFDDGYADNHDVALPILRELGLEATFFVSSGFLDGRIMWNDAIIESLRAATAGGLDLGELGLGRVVISDDASRLDACGQLLAALKYRTPAERARAVDWLVARLGVRLPHSLMMSPDQVADLARRGMEIGGHTVSHPILTRLTIEEARAEMREDKRTLEATIGRPLRLFAYPNGKPGRDYARPHVELVRESGYAAAVTTGWGAVRKGADWFQLPRISTRGDNAYSLALRVARAFAAQADTV